MDTELLAVFNDNGAPLGTKPRAAVHRDHDWHWLVFVWAVRRDDHGNLRMLLQLRSRDGDPYRGQIDAPAGGHVMAEEGHLQGALREFREEIGVSLDGDDLAHLGEKKLELTYGHCRRVIQHFYLCTRPLTLDEVGFSDEVGGVVEVDLDALADLIDGRGNTVPGTARFPAAPSRHDAVEITGGHLAAYPPSILNMFHLSLQAIRQYFLHGHIDATVWD